MAGAPAAAVDRSDPGALDAWKSIPANRRFLAGAVLALSNFMVVLDLTIANVSVPHIAGNLGISLDQGTWIITSYAVAEAICVPLTGWLADRFGAVRVFLWAMAGFGLFSLLCGMSVTLGMIVVCRIGQGLCGGPIMPMSQTLMVRVFPPEKRAMAMALWAMTVTAGPAMGPIVGGVISDDISWHWIFFINLPIAALCVGGGVALLRAVETSTRRVPIDRVGLGLLVLWIGALQIMLDIGRDHDWFGDWRIVALAITAGVGFCAFLIWELTEEHPIVDLRIFRHRGFSAAVFAQSLGFSAFFAGVVIVPQWLQASLGYSATKAGMISAAHAFAAVATSRFIAQQMPRFDPRLMISVGIGWLGVTSIFRTMWSSDVDFFGLAWPMMAQGLGIPMMMIPITTMALSTVEPAETASAAGLQNFMRTMSTALATSMVLTVWGNAQSVARSNLVGSLHEAPTRAALAGKGMTTFQQTLMIDQLVQKEAVTIAVNHVFWVAATVSFLAAAAIWLAPKVTLSRIGAGGPPAH